MARTKQTARKNTGGKPLAMGRGKATPKKNPPPGKSADRKVVVEYSSDEEPQLTEGAEAPKRVKKQIHLTLPASPAHVTTTESFTTFFLLITGLLEPCRRPLPNEVGVPTRWGS